MLSIKSYENYTTYNTYNSYITYQFSAQMPIFPRKFTIFQSPKQQPKSASMTEYSKYNFLENLRQRLERVPMLKVLVPLVAGILLADVVTLPLWGVAIGFVVCAGMGVVLRRRGVADLYIVVALVLAGFMGAEVRRSFASLPSERTTMEVVVENITAKRERTTHADGHLVAYATAQGTRRSRAEVRLSVSPEVEISRGDRLLVNATLRPFAEEESYGRYMLSRGVAGTL